MSFLSAIAIPYIAFAHCKWNMVSVCLMSDPVLCKIHFATVFLKYCNLLRTSELAMNLAFAKLWCHKGPLQFFQVRDKTPLVLVRL